MSKRWGIALMILAVGLLLASPNIMAVESKNPGPTNDSSEYLDPEVQLYIEQRINEKNLEDYEKIIEIKTKAIEDRFDAYKWFAIVILALLGGGGFVLIRYMVDARISKLKPEEKIQKKVDELYNIIESHKQDIDKLKQRAERDINKVVEEAKKIIAKNIRPEEMTPVQEEIIKEAAEEIKKKPEEEYSVFDYHTLAVNAAKKENFEEAIKYSKKSIQLDPNGCKGYWLFGALYYMDKQYDKAIEAFNKVNQLDPDFAFGHSDYMIARSYSLKKDKTNALKYLELAIDKGFDDIKGIEKRFDFIRNTPEYRQIIKKLKAKK